MCSAKYDINNVEIKKPRTLKLLRNVTHTVYIACVPMTLDHYSMMTLTVVINDEIASDTVILKRFR